MSITEQVELYLSNLNKNETAYKTMTLKQLKEQLKIRGLPKWEKVDEIINCLLFYDNTLELSFKKNSNKFFVVRDNKFARIIKTRQGYWHLYKYKGRKARDCETSGLFKTYEGLKSSLISWIENEQYSHNALCWYYFYYDHYVH